MPSKKVTLPLLSLFILLVSWYVLSNEDSSTNEILVQPTLGSFEVVVTNTGELHAKNSIKIMGPSGARTVGIWQMKIEKLIPEGTVVDSGDFVAELDKSELTGKFQDGQLSLQKVESQVTQAKLDSSLTLSQARDELVNLNYTTEESKIKMEQSQYESPAVRRQAEIDYERAQRSYNQAVSNYKTKVLQAKAKLEEVEADLSKERNKMENYRRVMGQFTVTAPENGMVVYAREYNGKKRSVGSTVSPWDPVVAELPDLSIMESKTYVNEVDIQKVKKGQSVRIGLDANPDKILTGVVDEVANIGEQRPNSDSKVFEVNIVIHERDTTLRPSMTTSNSILVEHLEEALFIPLEALFSNDEFSYVFKKDGLGLLRQEVALGSMNDNYVVVTEGVSLKDNIYLSMPSDTSNVPWARLDPVTASNSY